MMIRIENGKGGKDRYPILSSKFLDVLREYWKGYRPKEWLSFGHDINKPMPEGTAQRIYYNAKKNAGITKGRGIHTLRHCFASHMLWNGEDIYTIKRLLGHSSIKTTYKYFTVKETLQAFAGNPQWRLSGQLGFIAVLHTWNQMLLDHFHLHCLIPAGAISFEKKIWRPAIAWNT